ncbi:MAG: hypothetical protein H0Z22_04375 [Thermosipho sp. (in: Bacteria)]|nr:hypothetical protein [Thermosipho sp. (in: thermotogales)]
MKKKYFGILIVLIALTFIFSGCLQQVPPVNNGGDEGTTTNVVLDGIAKAKYDFLTTGATNLTITGIILAKNDSNIILHDATSGILIYDSYFLDTYKVNVGDLVTLDATFVYYYNDVEAKYNTIDVVSTSTTSETLTPVKLDIELNNDWLVDADYNDLTKESSDATSLALWLYRYVTVEGTLTISDDKNFSIEYSTDSGTSLINGYYKAGGLTPVTDVPATVTGYLGAIFDAWQLYIWDENNIEF